LEHLYDGRPEHVLQLLELLEGNCQALRIVNYKRSWTLIYDAVRGDPWVRVEAETGQVLGLKVIANLHS
jgi:hypothetical protein